MYRLIINYNIVQVSHIDPDEVEVSEKPYTVSIEAPEDIINRYNDGDSILPIDLLQFNKEDIEPTLCKKKHMYNDVELKCESYYHIASSAELVLVRYTKMLMEFDNVMAYHDGYCSGAECEYIENDSVEKTIDIPENLLGFYDDMGEIPVTSELRKKYSYTKGVYYGSNYCDRPETTDARFNMISECNVEHYVLTRITLV